MNKYLVGAIAGTLATVPMTIVMVKLHRRLPAHQRYPLPPRQITQEVANRTETRKALRGHLTAATLLAHFAYGGATGAPYPAVATRVRTPLFGPLYGVAVWMASYLGWIPMLRILRPATQHPRERNTLMLVAHVVWGSALASVTSALQRRYK